jgi:hypothetical protein
MNVNITETGKNSNIIKNSRGRKGGNISVKSGKADAVKDYVLLLHYAIVINECTTE